MAILLAFCLCLLSAASEPAASEESAKDFKDIDLKTIGVELVTPKKDQKTGFVVAGKNPTELIRRLTELNGRSITKLEADMRPGALSTKGFLGPDEKLLEVMAKDNDYVVGELGLTHQDLARHLHIIGAVGRNHYFNSGKAGKLSDKTEFVYHGRKYRVEVRVYRGYQDSPFDDGTKTDSDVTLHNLSNGKWLTYSLLVPHLIERYGFYEGHGTPYRVEPRKVVEVFDFLRVKKKKE